MQKAKEVYTACLILLIGTIYLAAQADSFFSIGSTTVKGDTIQLSKNELLSHTRTIVTIILCFVGGILLFRKRRNGWIVSLAVLFLLLSIAVGIFLSNITDLNTAGMLFAVGILMLLMATIFLLQKGTRQRFQVGMSSYLVMIVLFAALALFYFVLQ